MIPENVNYSLSSKSSLEVYNVLWELLIIILGQGIAM